MSRQVWPDAPAYSCLLWLWTKAMGTGEIMLRISSVLPMLGAVYLLYRAARELFERDVALIAAIVFCLHPIIIFAAIDVRPYAFAALAINASILALVHLRHNSSNWLAALFGCWQRASLNSSCCLRPSCRPWPFALSPLRLATARPCGGSLASRWRCSRSRSCR